MNKFLIIAISFLSALPLIAQVGINNLNPDPSAALDIASSDKGLLIPRVADTSSVGVPATGLMVYTTSKNQFFFYNGSKWQILGSVVQSELADADNDTKIQVEKNADDDIIRMNIAGEEKLIFSSSNPNQTRIEFPNNSENVAIGINTLFSNSSGASNVAVGALFSKTWLRNPYIPFQAYGSTTSF